MWKKLVRFWAMAKNLWPNCVSFYNSQYTQYFIKQSKNTLRLIWWFVAFGSFSFTALSGLLMWMARMTAEQTAIFLAGYSAKVIFITFIGAVIILAGGLLINLIDALIKLIKGRKIGNLEDDINKRITAIEGDVGQIKKDIEEIKQKLES